MPLPPLVIDDDAPELLEGLQQIRAEHDVPGEHGPEALREAQAAAVDVLTGLEASIGQGRIDARQHAFVTIDPAGSRDLDQALHIERRPGGGFVVRYAIADVAAFVAPGSALDGEVWQRGVTYYLPDQRSPLHPPSLSEGAASLLPAKDRPALLWTIELDEAGGATSTRLERAVVRSRVQRTYAQVQGAIDAGTAEGTEALLAEVGPLRQRIEADRGGVSLDLPTQRVRRDRRGYRLEREAVVPAMGWNAQISLLTGMEAARVMLEHHVGLLRTLPPAPAEVIQQVRRTAAALDVGWPAGSSYATEVGGLDSDLPAEAALLALAARGLRGAGYLPVHPAEPVGTGAAVAHAAVAAPYAHVTAPLRRLADRFANEVCVALFEGRDPAPEVASALDELPRAMARASGREASADRAVIDLVECLLLAHRVGEVLRATVVAVDERGSTVVIAEPAVQALVEGAALPLGAAVQVRVEPSGADRRVRLSAV